LICILEQRKISIVINIMRFNKYLTNSTKSTNSRILCLYSRQLNHIQYSFNIKTNAVQVQRYLEIFVVKMMKFKKRIAVSTGSRLVIFKTNINKQTNVRQLQSKLQPPRVNTTSYINACLYYSLVQN